MRSRLGPGISFGRRVSRGVLRGLWRWSVRVGVSHRPSSHLSQSRMEERAHGPFVLRSLASPSRCLGRHALGHLVRMASRLGIGVGNGSGRKTSRSFDDPLRIARCSREDGTRSWQGLERLRPLWSQGWLRGIR